MHELCFILLLYRTLHKCHAALRVLGGLLVSMGVDFNGILGDKREWSHKEHLLLCGLAAHTVFASYFEVNRLPVIDF